MRIVYIKAKTFDLGCINAMMHEGSNKMNDLSSKGHLKSMTHISGQSKCEYAQFVRLNITSVDVSQHTFICRINHCQNFL